MKEEGELIGSMDKLTPEQAKQAYDYLPDDMKEIVKDLMKQNKGQSIPIGRAKTLQNAVYLLNISLGLKKGKFPI